jgi:hypothetical protein
MMNLCLFLSLSPFWMNDTTIMCCTCPPIMGCADDCSLMCNITTTLNGLVKAGKSSEKTKN